MALATRQHVRAWEGELESVYSTAAWYLYGALWHWAAELKPELGSEERRQLLDKLLAPVLEPSTPGAVKAVLLGRLFQAVTLSRSLQAIG